MEAGRRNPRRRRMVGEPVNEEADMATRTRSQSGTNSNQGSGGGRGRSSFSWSSNQTGMLAAAAVAGAAVGLAANYGRKIVAQGLGGTDWLDELMNDHRAVLAMFDKLKA